ncbi:uncharacterized protein BDV17DRAFT_290720 [Aspergillus undulatus]|uniref:uncharacterized protein n=1 Tax=Aspergillus undulatus TaxID=1810928 RepID=UPI003CCCA3A4
MSSPMFGEVIFRCGDGHELREAPVCPVEGHWERFTVKEQDFFKQEDVVPCVKRRDYLPCDTIRILFAYPSRKALKNQPLRAALEKALISLNKKVEISELFYITSDTNQPYGDLGMKCSWSRIVRGIVNHSHTFHDYHAVFFLSLESSIDESNQPYDRPNLIIYEYFSGWNVCGAGCGPGVQKELLEFAKLADLEKGIEGYTTYGSILEGLFGEFGVEAPDWHAAVCRREERLKNRKGFIELLCRQVTEELDLSDAFRFTRPSVTFMMGVFLRRAKNKMGSYLKMLLNLN